MGPIDYSRPLRLLGLLGLIFSQSVWATDKPNVVIIVGDDLGWADVGYHGGGIDTPSLDRLAAEVLSLNGEIIGT